MKLTKLSLVAALAVSAAFAGGDIAPVEPVVEAPAPMASCGAKPGTTIAGKLTGYYITDDLGDAMFGDGHQLGLGATLDVSHAFTDWLTANFSAVGYLNALKLEDSSWGYFEGQKSGAFFNVANLTATFADTTVVAGRQILDTPMVKSFDWLLSPESYEAYTIVNTSINNVTLVGSYLRTYRGINSGDNFATLDGDNWIVGAAYSDAFDASVWYYNVDSNNYTQVYADAGTEFSGIKMAAQFVSTNYDAGKDSTAFGVKASTSIAGLDLMAAYNNVSDAPAAAVGTDGLYASSWNEVVAGTVGDSYKVEAATEFSGLSASASYAYYSYDLANEEGHEIDVILGYGLTKSVSLDAIYSNTDYGDGAGDVNALEVIATYNF